MTTASEKIVGLCFTILTKIHRTIGEPFNNPCIDKCKVPSNDDIAIGSHITVFCLSYPASDRPVCGT